MRRLTFLLVLAILAVPAGTALAGGWATVEVAAPAGLSAGEPWRAELRVLQHGRTPLDGLSPSVEITDEAGAVRTFEARPTGQPGTYVATVTYPAAGTWRTRFYDGFTDVTPHRLAPLTVAPAGGAAPAAALAGDAFPSPQSVAVALVALLWIGGCVAAWRSRRPRRYLPAP